MRSPNSTVYATDSWVCTVYTPSRLVEHGTHYDMMAQFSTHPVLFGLRMLGDLSYYIYYPRLSHSSNDQMTINEISLLKSSVNRVKWWPSLCIEIEKG